MKITRENSTQKSELINKEMLYSQIFWWNLSPVSNKYCHIKKNLKLYPIMPSQSWYLERICTSKQNLVCNHPVKSTSQGWVSWIGKVKVWQGLRFRRGQHLCRTVMHSQILLPNTFTKYLSSHVENLPVQLAF